MDKAWTSRDIPSQSGKRIIVTGANSGIGWNAAVELARAGAEVTIPARTQAKADDAVTRIRAQVPQAKLKTALLDLSSQGSVRAFAMEQLNDARPIDTLINNAGVMALPERRLSVDGNEMQFATNVLGPFTLTGLLLGSLLRAPAPRVVTVSSSAHMQGGPVPLQDLNSERRYDAIKAYAKTKLANVLFARELQRRAGKRLLSTACHPGYARTNLQFNDSSFTMMFVSALFWPLSQTSARGAEPTLFCATAPGAEPAAYYGPGGLMGMRGNVANSKMATFAYDDTAAGQLFDQLQSLTGVSYAF